MEYLWYLNSPVVFRTLWPSWTALFFKMSLGADVKEHVDGWSGWGLTQVLLLSCSHVCLLMQTNSDQQGDVHRNPLYSSLRGCTLLKEMAIPPQHPWRG